MSDFYNTREELCKVLWKVSDIGDCSGYATRLAHHSPEFDGNHKVAHRHSMRLDDGARLLKACEELNAAWEQFLTGMGKGREE